MDAEGFLSIFFTECKGQALHSSSHHSIFTHETLNRDFEKERK